MKSEKLTKSIPCVVLVGGTITEVCGFGIIYGVNILRAGSGLVVLTGTVSWLLVSEA